MRDSIIRKQGFVRGLRAAHDIVRKAKNYESRQERETSDGDADIKAEFEHGANILHGVCLKIQDAIGRAVKG